MEIIRQTPLNTLKFLDVLFISELLDKQKSCKPQNLESLNSTSFCKKPLEVSSSRAKIQNPKSSSYKNEISVSESKYQTINYDVNHNKQPIDFIESDYEESKNCIRSFDLNIPVYRNLKCDRTIKSSDSVDSGFCSFQSIKSEDLKQPDIVEMVPVTEQYNDQIEIKPKTKLRRSDSFKSNVSSSCLNLLSKFRRISVKDNNNESSHKRDSPTKLSDPGAIEGVEKKKNNRLWDFKTRSTAIKREPSLEQVHKIILNDKSERRDLKCQDFDKPMTHSKSPSYRNAPEEIRKARERISNFLHKNKYMHEICPETTSIPPADSFSSRDKETGAEQNSLALILDFRLKESVSESLDQNRGKSRNGDNEKCNTMPDVLKDLPETRTKCKPSVTFQLPENVLQNENTNVLVRLLTKCQIDKEYVPVREKRLMFESLSRFSFSVDNLKRRKFPHLNEDGELVRSSSLHDLHNKSPIPVRVMKNYFESFSDKSHNVSSTWNKKRNPAMIWNAKTATSLPCI